MKKIILITALIFTFCVSAQDRSGIPASFVDIGFGSRPMGMGGAFTGLSDDINSVLWNPAGLSSLGTQQAMFTFTNQLNLIQYHYLAYGMPLSESDGFGVALIYSGDKALTEMTLQAGYAMEVFSDLSAGINLKYRYASFGNNSFDENEYQIFDPDEIAEGKLNQVKGNAGGFGFDIGLLYKLSEQLKFGLMYRDIYSPVSWNSKVENTAKTTKGTYSETVPSELSVGSSFKLIKEIILAVDYSPGLYKDASDKIRGGVEANLLNILYLRSGFQKYMVNENNDKYMFGLGFDFKEILDLRILVDYTFMIEHLANTQRFSLGFTF